MQSTVLPTALACYDIGAARSRRYLGSGVYGVCLTSRRSWLPTLERRQPLLVLRQVIAASRCNAGVFPQFTQPDVHLGNCLPLTTSPTAEFSFTARFMVPRALRSSETIMEAPAHRWLNHMSTSLRWYYQSPLRAIDSSTRPCSDHSATFQTSASTAYLCRAPPWL